jgi:predicted nucleic acid-binding protein
MLAALDSNIILYAEGFNDEARRAAAQSYIHELGPKRIVLPAQAIGEMVNAQIKKAKRPSSYAIDRAQNWITQHIVQDTTTHVLEGAFDIVEQHQFQWWDAVILSASHIAGASVLLSEDMQAGFSWRGVTIINPFLFSPKELLAFISLATRH